MKTFAYIALVVGALGLGGLMVRDIVSGLSEPTKTPTAAVQGSTEAPLGPLSADAVPVALKPETVDRIDQILNPDAEGAFALGSDSRVADADLTPVAQAQQELPPVEPQQSGSSKVSASPIRQQTPLHPKMVTPGNFVYLGGFRPEFGDGNGYRYGFGGTAITFRPDGDPNGPDDGFPGSLYLAGHRRQQMVAEISIPKPFLSLDKNIDDLPEAKILQPFSDITKGLRDRMTNGSSEAFEIGGMHVIGSRLYWTLYKYYNVTNKDYLSHGLTTVDLSSNAYRGPWHLGPYLSGESRWNSYKNAGYITDIPKGVADRYLNGMNFLSGLQISTGRQVSSQGPALYAYKIKNEELQAGGSLDAVPLLWYPMEDEMEGHHPSDSWQGAAWVTLGDKQAVIIVGRKGLGPVYYGPTRPNDCYDWKGYHASAYETQVLFYRPEDILAGAKKRVPNTPTWYRWDSKTPGGSLNRFMFQDCGKEIGGCAYDRERNLLYISEIEAGRASVNAYEDLPVIHVLKIVE